MVGLDLIIAVFAAFLLVKGIWKGFVKEIAGIAAVLLGVGVAFLFHERGETLLSPYVGKEYIGTLSYVLLFILTYVAISLLGNLIDKILKSIMLGGINRILGGVFGLIKAVLWCTLITYAYSTLHANIGFEHPQWVSESVVYPFLIDLVEMADAML